MALNTRSENVAWLLNLTKLFLYSLGHLNLDVLNVSYMSKILFLYKNIVKCF